jgi:hypothetical protein
MKANEALRAATDLLARAADTGHPGTLPADFDAVLDAVCEALPDPYPYAGKGGTVPQQARLIAISTHTTTCKISVFQCAPHRHNLGLGTPSRRVGAIGLNSGIWRFDQKKRGSS